MYFSCLYCPVWHKPSVIDGPGVPAYLVNEFNAALAGILLALSIVLAAKSIKGLHRRFTGQPKFTD